MKEPRKAFFDAYKEIEALWEILSPHRNCAMTSRPFTKIFVRRDSGSGKVSFPNSKNLRLIGFRGVPRHELQLDRY